MGGSFYNTSITIEQFHCIECKKILKPPIILTSTGNLCLHHCTQKRETRNYEVEPRTRNSSLELIMEHITCACRYRESGCEEIVKLNKIAEHEESCRFKTFICMLAGCEWLGIEADYLSHLHEHTDYIDRGSDGMFLLNCVTDGTDTDDVRILRTVSGLSLLHLKVLKHKLICAVYDIENPYTESYKIWMTCSTSLGKIHNEYPCQIVDSLNRFKNFESFAGTEIIYNTLNPVSNKNVTVCLEHVYKGEIVSSALEDKSKYAGQLLLLEKMQVRLPCKNASLGCQEKHTPISQHEDTSCYYKSWKCCAQTDSEFVGPLIKLLDHIDSNHESIRNNETMVPLNLDSYKTAFIIYGNVFLLEYKNLQIHDWTNWQVLQLTDCFKASRNFGVEVTINTTDSRKSFYLRDGFKKNSLNEDRCFIMIRNSVVTKQ